MLLKLVFLGWAAPAFSQDMDIPSSINVMADKEFVALKESYQICTFEYAEDFLQTSKDIELTIKYSQIACKRDLLKMKKFLINGAFKVDVVDSLIDSIRQGVEIDLVIHVFELAKKTIK